MSFQQPAPQPADGTRSTRPALTTEWWIAGAAAALTVLLYASTLDNPFVYDDFRLIVENPSIQKLSDLRTVFVRDITRPLVNLTYISDTVLWGTRPFGYHLTNILLHALNVVAVFWVAFGAASDWQRQGGGRFGFSPAPRVVATVTSLLVAAHPITTQAVGYITARSELLYAFFFLLAWLSGRQWMLVGGWWRWASLTSWVLAIMGKETAAMLPLVLWCYDAWLIGGDPKARARRVKGFYLPLGLTVLLFGAGRLAVLATLEYPKDAGPDWRFAFVEVDAFWRYVALFLWPKGQTLMHTVAPTLVPMRLAAGVAGIFGLLGAVYSLRRVQPVIGLGLVVTVAMLVPSSVLFAMGIGEPMAEHRAYVSAMGFFLAIGVAAGMAWARARAYGRGALAFGAAGAVCLAQLAGATVLRNAVWGDTVALAQEAVSLSPRHWMPRLFLGETLRQNGRCPDAIVAYRETLALHAGESFTRKKLLGCLIETGRIAEAEQELRVLRDAEPDSPEAAMGLGLLAVVQGHADESRRYFHEIIARDPGHRDARQFVALLDGSLGEPDRSALCNMVRAVAAAAPSLGDSRAPAVCP